jgi:hypothetical protein
MRRVGMSGGGGRDRSDAYDGRGETRTRENVARKKAAAVGYFRREKGFTRAVSAAARCSASFPVELALGDGRDVYRR